MEEKVKALWEVFGNDAQYDENGNRVWLNVDGFQFEGKYKVEIESLSCTTPDGEVVTLI